MKHLFITLILFAAVSFSQNNRPIKVNLLAYFDKVPAPPATCKEAHDKCDCNDPNYTGVCNSDKIFAALNEEIQKFQTDIANPPGSLAGDMAKQMQDPAFKEKMEKMSQAEKMQFAIQMAQANMPGAPQPEPASVTTAIKDFSDANEVESAKYTKMNEAVQAQMKHKEELEAKHRAVDEWKAAGIKKIPVQSSGEMSYQDPKALAAAEIAAFKKHFAIVEEELKLVAKNFAETKAGYKKQYAKYQASMEKIHYGDDAKNNSSKSMLATGQTQMLTALGTLAGQSKVAFDDAAQWYERMVQYQKQQQQ